MVLSNDERSIEDTMSEIGKTAKAGQSIRLLSIPIFGKYGAFNNLHDKKDGRELSDHLQTAAKKIYGTAGIEYLTKLVAETRNIDELAEQYTLKLINGETLSSQEARAAKRFALVALAGELATEYGVTGGLRVMLATALKSALNNGVSRLVVVIPKTDKLRKLYRLTLRCMVMHALPVPPMISHCTAYVLAIGRKALMVESGCLMNQD
jgi:hypothetical protein